MTLPSSSRRGNQQQLKPTTGPYDSPARPASPAYDVDDDTASDLSDNNNENGNAASPQVEQLLVNHLRFAHAFRKNDAAMILQFLAKDVALVSVDGARHEGQSAVLAYLVGARMTKISSNLHVKGCPTRSGACQSTFIYEHGIVFKDPLFMEVLDWKPNSATIVRIAHIALPDAKSGKMAQDFSKSSPLRLSFGNRMSEEDSSESSRDSDASDAGNNNDAGTPSPVKVRCRRLKSNSSADTNAAMTAVTAASLRLSSSSSSSSSQSGTNEAAVQPVTADVVPAAGNSMPPTITLAEISCAGLTPIRKRKTVNPFVLLQIPEKGTVWKSPVMRRDPNPKWNHIPLKIPAQRLADVVEISLWDHTFFRSVKVAGAALVVADLLKDDAEFCATVQLERFDGARAAGDPQHVTLQLRFVRPRGGDMAARSSDEVEQSPAQYDDPELIKSVTASSVLSSSFKWLVVDPFVEGHHSSVLLMLVRAAIVAAIVWVLFHAALVWPMQV